MGRVRIVFVIDSLAPGGAERSLVSIVPHLIERGVDPAVVVVHDREGLGRDLLSQGVEVQPIESSRFPVRVRWLRSFIRATRPDLVHTTLFEADVVGRVAARQQGVPVVSTLANESYGRSYRSYPGVNPLGLRAAQAMDIATARLVRRFHAVSGGVADTMARRLLVPRGRIEVVHRGRDAAALGRRTPERSAAVRSALGLEARTPLLVAVARHEHDKGLDVAVRAMPAVRERAAGACLVIAGRTGNQSTLLLQLAREYGPDAMVRFLGPRDDVPDLLSAADVFIAPSRREGLPGAVLEAMALEAPIVTTDLANVREAVGANGESAVLVPPGSIGALAEAVVEVFRSPAETAAKAANGRRRFEEMFTIERAASRMLAFYERALG